MILALHDGMPDRLLWYGWEGAGQGSLTNADGQGTGRRATRHPEKAYRRWR
jgi:hypothetical protein